MESSPETARSSESTGLCTQRSERRVFINDVCVCQTEDDEKVLCRARELFWDEEQGRVLISVTRFRTAPEVYNTGDDNTVEGLTRVWEESSADPNETMGTSAILDLGEIYTIDEVQQGVHNTDTWIEGERSQWGPFVGEGFVLRCDPKKRRRSGGGGPASPPSFEISHTYTMGERGTPDNPLFTVRKAGFYLNRGNLPFFSAPCVWMNDAFNATWMGVTNSIGGGYFGWAWRNNAVQRKRREAHVGTIASTGACYEGEIGFQCDILGILQKGCLAKVRVEANDGATKFVKVKQPKPKTQWCSRRSYVLQRSPPFQSTHLCVALYSYRSASVFRTPARPLPPLRVPK